jgi:RsmE family RNA methyltransferase
MPRYDFRTPRLYLEVPLHDGATIALDPSQANYLGNVLRLKPGDSVLVFNGRDGEWQGALASAGKRRLALTIGARTRPQGGALDLHYWFAPLKHARLDYMAQKAVEMGASRLQPVLTRHAQVARVNLERLRANAIEAAEQCGILTLPDIGEPRTLEEMLHERAATRLLVFCDEEAEVKDPVAALVEARRGLRVRRSACGPHRPGRGLCRGGARRAAQIAEHRAACARAAHSAGRYRRGCGIGTGRGGAGGLAVTASIRDAPRAGVKRFLGLTSNSPRQRAKRRRHKPNPLLATAMSTGMTWTSAAPDGRADALITSFERAGYVRVSPAILQPAEPFLDLSGEDIRKRMYLTTDPQGRELCLRPDLTIPVSRDYLASPAAGAPQALCYLGPVFRHRAEGAAEFLQAGIESFGRPDTAAADAEMLALGLEATAHYGLGAPDIRMGDVALFSALIAALDLAPAWKRRLIKDFNHKTSLVQDLDRLAISASHARPEYQGVLAALAGSDPDAAHALVTDLLSIAGITAVGGRSVDEIADRFLEQSALGARPRCRGRPAP